MASSWGQFPRCALLSAADTCHLFAPFVRTLLTTATHLWEPVRAVHHTRSVCTAIRCHPKKLTRLARQVRLQLQPAAKTPKLKGATATNSRKHAVASTTFLLVGGYQKGASHRRFYYHLPLAHSCSQCPHRDLRTMARQGLANPRANATWPDWRGPIRTPLHSSAHDHQKK